MFQLEGNLLSADRIRSSRGLSARWMKVQVRYHLNLSYNPLSPEKLLAVNMSGDVSIKLFKSCSCNWREKLGYI